MEAGGETTVQPVVAADHHIYCNIHHLGKEALLGTFIPMACYTQLHLSNFLMGVIK